uniref:PHD-type domain-containing protein n=1 Tax=Panagrolaimus sp. JU765 TaxID=591449 RepID=A0AC34R914_9BILA
MDDSELPENQNVDLKPKFVEANGEKLEGDVAETMDDKMDIKEEQTDIVKAETTKTEPNDEMNKSELRINVKSPSASLIDPSVLYNEPLFAEVCSFFNYFACYLSMKPLSIVQLEKMFLNTEAKEEIDRELLELHLTLMRKIGYKSARQDRWENFLQKFLVFINADEESLQLERCGYPYLSLPTKLQILFQLCVRQFDHNIKFKEAIFNTLSYNELRLAPVGRDKHGLNYFYQQDNELNVRVYTQEPEDESGGTWSLVVRSHTDLIKLIESLKQPNFGSIKEEHDEDVDETALLEVDTTKSPILKPEVADKYYNYLAKRNTFKDVFRDGTDINKKKNEKLAKKEAKAAAAAAASVAHSTPKPEKAKSEEKEEESQDASATQEEPEIPPELLEEEEGRRILPRRNARNAAINNLKNFTHTPVKKKVEEKKKEETEEESDDDEDEDSELDDGSDPSLGSSDEEFNIGNGKKKSSRPRKPRKPKNEDEDGEPKKKKKKKKVVISFEDSSEEEMEEEQIKERKKATIHSLCMKCNKANHPEVLLLCDMCDDPWHTFCLKPTLWYVPDDDWFCPKCHHAMLVNRLEKIETELCESLKVKKAEETKKKAAAERLQREMEYIGVSLNNVIQTSNTRYGGYDDDEISESESDDDGQRKSKKRALKRVMGRSRKQERYMGPIVTIAEGRSRRQTKKVDYNFSAYDEQLQEAMDVIDEPTIKTKYENDHRPSGGVGQKDMSNILNANRRTHDDEYEDENDEPAPKKRKTKSKRLTDLDVDATDSDTDEYKASEQSEEDAEPSEEEYVPSDIERGRRRSGRRGGRRRSDDEFIDDDGGSDSDYNPSKKKRKGAGTTIKRSSGRKKRSKYGSDEDSDNEEYFDNESSDDGYRKKRKPKPMPKKRSKVESEEEDELDEEAYSEEDDTPKKMTAYGRPMRKAAAKAVLKETDDEEEEESEAVVEEKEKRPVGALTRKIEKEEEFEPDEEEEEEADEEEVEAEEELEKEAVDENEEEEPEESSSLEEEEEEEAVPTMVKKGPAPKKTPPKPKERRAPPPPRKDQHEPVEKRVQPARSPVKKQVSVEKKQEPSPAPAPPQPVVASVPPVASATPPMVKPIPITVCQPSSSISYQPQFAPPPPVSSIYSPYTTAAPLPRFAAPPSSYGPPPGGYYPASTYGHPLVHPQMMPTYVMQPPPVGPYGGHPGFPQNTMTMLDPMNPHGHGHIPPSPYGLQPIQLSQPSDSDGLAQAIAGAMNSDL